MFAELSPPTVAVVLGMAVLTYVTKAGGLFVLSRVDLSETSRAGLEALPGGIIVAILAPTLLRGGPPEWLAGALVVVVASRTDSVLLALGVGVGSVLLLRGGVAGLGV